MQQIALSKKILKRFAHLEPERLLQTWFRDLMQQNTYHSQLFAQQSEIAYHFDHKDPGICLLGVPIAAGLTQELFNRFYSMQQVIHNQQYHVKGIDCLVVIQPLFKQYYLDKFKVKPFAIGLIAATNLTPAEVSAETKKIADHSLALFKEITVGLYQPSTKGYSQSRVPSNQAITKTLRLTTLITAEIAWEILQAKQHSPVQQLEILNTLQKTKLHLIKESLLQQTPDSLDAFQRLPVKQQVQLISEIESAIEKLDNQEALNEAKQLWLLKAIAKTPFHTLSLKHFSTVITDQTLQPVLEQAGPYLLKLDLNHCDKLSYKTLKSLPYVCPNLIYLYANHLKLIKVIKGDYLKLQVLEVSGCDQLMQIDVTAPTLKRLKANTCQLLTYVKTESLVLKDINFTNCNSLQEAGILNLASVYGNLQEVLLINSGIICTKFRESYPFLINLPMEEQHSQLENYLEQYLVYHLRSKKLAATSLDPIIANQINQSIKNKILFVNQIVSKVIKMLSNYWNNNKIGGAIVISMIAKDFYLPGKQANQIFGLLLKLIKESDLKLRSNAILALGSLKTVNANLISVLVDLLRDENGDPYGEVRAAIATVLGNLGEALTHNPSDITKVTTALIDVLEDRYSKVQDSLVHEAAEDALIQLGKIFPAVITVLLEMLDKQKKNSFRNDVCKGPVKILGNLREMLSKQPKMLEKVISSLMEALLKDPNLNVNLEASAALVKLEKLLLNQPEDMKKIILVLLDALHNQDSDRRVAAATVLISLNIEGEDVVKILLDILQISVKDSYGILKPAVVNALGNLHEKLRKQPEIIAKVIATLVGILQNQLQFVLSRREFEAYGEQLFFDDAKHYSVATANAAAEALGNLKIVSKEVTAALVEQVESGSLQVRLTAAVALGKLNMVTERMISGLWDALRNKDLDYYTYKEFTKTLEDLHGVLTQQSEEQIKTMIKKFLEALQSSVSYTRVMGVSALGILKVVNEDVMQSLIEKLADEDALVRTVAAGALLKLGKEPQTVITILWMSLRDSNRLVRTIAAEGIGTVMFLAKF